MAYCEYSTNVSESLHEGSCYCEARDNQYNVLLDGSVRRDPERMGGAGRGSSLEDRKHVGSVTGNPQDLFSGSSESERKRLVRATSHELPQRPGKPFLRWLLHELSAKVHEVPFAIKPYFAIFGSLVS